MTEKRFGPQSNRIGSFFASEIVATTISNREFPSQFDGTPEQAERMLSSDNLLVLDMERRLEQDTAQFESVSQPIVELIINGAEAYPKDRDGDARCEVTIDDTSLTISDNGKGMTRAEFLEYFLLPHYGEEGKIRGQFGMGAQSIWGLLKEETGTIARITSVSEKGERFDVVVGYRYDENTKRVRRFIDFYDADQITKTGDNETGTRIEISNLDRKTTETIAHEIPPKLEDISYAEITINGEQINEKAFNALSYLNEDGVGILLIGRETESEKERDDCDTLASAPGFPKTEDIPLHLTSTTAVKTNVRGETLASSGTLRTLDNAREKRIVLELPKYAITSETRTIEHVRLTKEDILAIEASISAMTIDGRLSSEEKLEALSALTRSIALLARTNETPHMRNLETMLVDEINLLLEETGFGILDFAENVDYLNLENTVFIDPKYYPYTSKEARETPLMIARGWEGEPPIYQAPMEGLLGDELLLRIGDRWFISEEVLASRSEDGELVHVRGEEAQIRAAFCNTLVRLSNNRQLPDDWHLAGRFNPKRWMPAKANLDEPKKLERTYAATPIETSKAKAETLSTESGTATEADSAVRDMVAEILETSRQRDRTQPESTNISAGETEDGESVVITEADIDAEIERISSEMRGYIDKIANYLSEEELELFFGGREVLYQYVDPANWEEANELAKKSLYTKHKKAWGPILDFLTEHGEEEVALRIEHRVIGKNFYRSFYRADRHRSLERTPLFLDIIHDFRQAPPTDEEYPKIFEDYISEGMTEQLEIRNREHYDNIVALIREGISNLSDEDLQSLQHQNLAHVMESGISRALKNAFSIPFSTNGLPTREDLMVLASPGFSTTFSGLINEENIHQIISAIGPGLGFFRKTILSESDHSWNEFTDLLPYLQRYKMLTPHLWSYLSRPYERGWEQIEAIFTGSIYTLQALARFNEGTLLHHLPTIVEILEEHKKTLSHINGESVSALSDALDKLSQNISSSLEQGASKDEIASRINVLFRLSNLFAEALIHSEPNNLEALPYIQDIMQMSTIYEETERRINPNSLSFLLTSKLSGYATNEILFHKMLIKLQQAQHHIKQGGSPDDLRELEILLYEGKEPMSLPLRERFLELSTNYPEFDNLFLTLISETKSEYYHINTERTIDYLGWAIPNSKIYGFDPLDILKIHNTPSYFYWLSGPPPDQEEIHLGPLTLDTKFYRDFFFAEPNTQDSAHLPESIETDNLTFQAEYDLSSQAAIYIQARALGLPLTPKTLSEGLEESSAHIDWARRDLLTTINAQGGGAGRFFMEWRQNAQNAAFERRDQIPSDKRFAIIDHGYDSSNRRYARMIDFAGMDVKTAIWALDTVGMTFSKEEDRNLARFRRGWLTTLRDASKVRVRTSIGDGQVSDITWIPIRDRDGSIIDIRKKVKVYKTEEETSFTEMIWYSNPGFENIAQTHDVEETVENSGRFLTKEELTLYQAKGLPLDLSVHDICQFKHSCWSIELSKVRLNIGGKEVSFESKNDPIKIGDSLNNWQLRLQKSSREGPKHYIIQGGFKIDDEMPQLVLSTIPKSVRHTAESNNIGLVLSIPPEIDLTIARDRIHNIEDIVEKHGDAVTAISLRWMAKAIITGDIDTSYTKGNLSSGRNPLPYDFAEKFFERAKLSREDLDIALALGNLVSDSQPPDLSRLRAPESENGKSVFIAVNIPIVKIEEDGPNILSITDLLAMNAGAEYLLHGSIPEGESIFSLIDDLVEKKDGELYLSDYGKVLIIENAKFVNKIRNRFTWVRSATNKFIKKNLRMPPYINRLIKRGEYAYNYTTNRFLETITQVNYNPASLENSTITALATLSSIALLAGYKMIFHKGRRKSIQTEFIPITQTHQDDQSKQQRRRQKRRSVKITDKDAKRVRHLVASQLNSLRAAAKAGQKEVAPDEKGDRMIGNKWDQIYNGDSYFALAMITASWARYAFEKHGLYHVSPTDHIGFYIQENPVKSVAHARPRLIAFNLAPELNDRIPQAAKEFIKGNISHFIEIASETIVHEATHWTEGEDSQGGDNTHSPLFHEMVFQGYQNLMRYLLATIDTITSDQPILQIELEQRSIANRYEPQIIPGVDFYKRLGQ